MENEELEQNNQSVDENNNPVNDDPPDDDEPQFELSPEDATSLDGSGDLKPAVLNRKKLLIYICIGFSIVVLIALFSSLGKKPKNSAVADDEYSQRVSSQQDFLNSLQNRAIRTNSQRQINEEIGIPFDEEPEAAEEPEPLLPEVALRPNPDNQQQLQVQPYQQQPARPQQTSSGGGGGGGGNQNDPRLSSLVPQVQGGLYSSGYSAQPPQPAQNPAAQYVPGQAAASLLNASANSNNNSYAAQNSQDNKNSFYAPSNGGEIAQGQFIGDNSIWMGTVIPGVLETAINTDLPGNIIARVTNNIYDSRTGRVLLIPQGSLLLARYNSSVSYAQKRVQIIWDTLIRPDGFEISLGGAPGVDDEGMSGQAGKYSENWFEYAKAAGIIALFSFANANLVSMAAQYGGNNAAISLANSSSQVVNELGGNIISRAMNIQPTLTVENGATINIMLNKTLYLPPAVNYPVNQRYVLERR